MAFRPWSCSDLDRAQAVVLRMFPDPTALAFGHTAPGPSEFFIQSSARPDQLAKAPRRVVDVSQVGGTDAWRMIMRAIQGDLEANYPDEVTRVSVQLLVGPDNALRALTGLTFIRDPAAETIPEIPPMPQPPVLSDPDPADDVVEEEEEEEEEEEDDDLGDGADGDDGDDDGVDDDVNQLAIDDMLSALRPPPETPPIAQLPSIDVRMPRPAQLPTAPGVQSRTGVDRPRRQTGGPALPSPEDLTRVDARERRADSAVLSMMNWLMQREAARTDAETRRAEDRENKLLAANTQKDQVIEALIDKLGAIQSASHTVVADLTVRAQREVASAEARLLKREQEYTATERDRARDEARAERREAERVRRELADAQAKLAEPVKAPKGGDSESRIMDIVETAITETLKKRNGGGEQASGGASGQQRRTEQRRRHIPIDESDGGYFGDDDEPEGEDPGPEPAPRRPAPSGGGVASVISALSEDPGALVELLQNTPASTRRLLFRQIGRLAPDAFEDLKSVLEE